MKKILKSAVAILVIISCFVMLVSCAQPKKDMDKAAKNLRNSGYEVYVNEDPGAGMETIITAKKNSDGKTYSLKFMECETLKLAKLLYQQLRNEIQSQINENKMSIKAAKHILNKFDDELSASEKDEYNQMINDLKDENKELKELLSCTGRSGKYVWQGDREAIKATK